MIGPLLRHARSLSVVGGFLFGIVGAAWSFTFDDTLGREASRLSDARADLTAQVRSLNAIASDYFIANQQGDLIFLTANQDPTRRDIAELIYKGNLLDRATPVRNMIGALAIAKELDYREAYGAYEALNDKARDQLSAENFFRLKAAEREIIAQGQARVPVLTDRLFELEKAINANARAQERNRAIGLISSILGNTLLVFANLIASRQKPGP